MVLPVRGAWMKRSSPIYRPTWLALPPPLWLKKTASPGCSSARLTSFWRWAIIEWVVRGSLRLAMLR